MTFTWLFYIFLQHILRQSSALPQDNGDIYKTCMKDALIVSEIFCLPADYKKDVPPPIKGPIDVYFKLVITEVSKIDDQRSQISIRWTYKLMWPEPRMILNSSADWSTGELNVRGDMVDNFWTPDIIIHDLVSFYKPEILNQVAALEIKKKNRLYYKVRSDMTMVCKGMKFSRFPLDEHVCYLKLTSFGYDDRKMVLGGQFEYEEDNQRALPFNVKITEISDELKVHRGSTSNYSVYGLEIRLSRCVSPYLLNVYLPTAIFVVMSWVSFLIPTDVVPARIVLLVTLCLVIINTFNNVTARIPVASQVTALEVWLLACILLVFGALAEYAFILRQVIKISREERRKRNLRAASQSSERQHREQADYDLQQPLSRPMSSMQMHQLVKPSMMHLDPNGQNRTGSPLTQDVAAQTGKCTVFHGAKDEWNERAVEVLEACLETNMISADRHSEKPSVHSRKNTSDRFCHHHQHQDHGEERLAHSQTRSLMLPPVNEVLCSGLSRASSLTTLSEKKRSRPRRQKKSTEQLMRRYQEDVDGKALVLFPIAFVLFNVGYWAHYLLNSA